MRFPAAAFSLLCLLPIPLTAQENSAFTWDNGTELSLVSSAGNASSSTLGVKSALTGATEGQALKFEVGGIRASSTITTRTAVGTASSYALQETVVTQKSAENYFAKGRYDRTFGGAFGFGGLGWERNTFAGVNARWSAVVGLGRTWVDTDTGKFKTDLGGTYTLEKPVEPNPDGDEGFGGLRATVEATRALNATTDFATTFVLDENLQNSEDLRFDWVASIAVALSEGLAFKTSYQVLFDNQPAQIGVPLFDTGGGQTGKVSEPSERVDSFLTLSLVIKL